METAHNRRLDDKDPDPPGMAVDFRARQMARTAQEWMDAHEKLCTERWDQSRVAFKDMRDTFTTFSSNQTSQFRWLMGMLLVALFSSIGVLVTKLLEHVK